ncbi:MAG: triose-phosphate isomerase [Burkholderiaceae bacterium]|nr:triose-phosphate isomerase [Burkholderiaceae bacterium]
MKVRKPLVAGNWKMNGSIAANEQLFTALRAAPERTPVAKVEVVVFPPYPYLGQAAAWLGDTGIAWGAQDVSGHSGGAHTGEVSAAMLADLGCRWAVIGHSERRQAGESDRQVAAKLEQCALHGIGAIVCVGETLAEREGGLADAVLARQLDAIRPALVAGGAALAPSRFVLAYEPVWAIGTGRTASPDTAQAAHRFLRERLATHGYREAGYVRILYGGSVKADNAASLFAMPDVDGGLIGGASLLAEDFLNICRAAALA